MRIESVTLRNYRGVEDRTIEFDDGVTLISGPNEVGKSSIAEALRLIRTKPDSSKAREIQAITPVHKDVGPEVVVVVTTGPYRVEYAKRWRKRATTTLNVFEPSPEQHTGREADQRYLEILKETLDIDLLEALEVQQGKSLDQPDLAQLRVLQNALGDEESDESDDALMERINAEYEVYFTPRSGKPSKEGRALSDAVQELTRERDRLMGQSQEMQAFVDEHAERGVAIDRANRSIASMEEELAALKAKDKELRGLAESRDASDKALADATERLKRACAARDERREAIAWLERTDAEITEEQSVLDDRDADRESAAEARDAAHERARRLEKEQAEVDADLTKLRRALDRHRAVEAVEKLEARVKAAQQADDDVRAAEAQMEAEKVDEGALKRLTKLQQDLRVAEAAQEAAAANITVRAMGGHSVGVDDDTVQPGAQDSRPVIDPVRVTVDGIVEVTVQPGRSPEDLQQGVDAAHAALVRELSKLQVADIAAAQESAERRHRASQAVQDAKARRDQNLDGAELSELEVELARIQAKVSEDAPSNLGESDTWEARIAELDERRTGLVEELASAREELEERRESASEAHTVHASAQAALEEKRRNADQHRRRLAEAREADSDDALAAAVEQADTAVEQATAMRDEQQMALDEADPESVAEELENLEDSLETQQKVRNEARERRSELQGLLRDRERLGIRDLLDDAEAELEEVTQRYERFQRRAAAIQLLHRVITARRDEAQARYVAPFTSEIDRLGKILYNEEMQVEVTPDLHIASRTVDGRTVAFESLSGGTQEQLALLGRLACAQLVDREQGAPLILDDALGFTDEDRLRALGRALAKVGRTTQVIVLTCQPDRYKYLGKAKHVTLPLRGEAVSSGEGVGNDS